MNVRFDVFVSHASEDKEEFARPLAHALRELGLRVWYDEFSLQAGDSLRRAIDRGLAESKYGVVILSPNFFAKGWPEWELSGLVHRHLDEGYRVIIPIWHRVSSQDVAAYSRAVADIVAIRSSIGLCEVADQIRRIVLANNAVEEARTDSGHERALFYVGTIKGVVGDAGDEIRLHVRLPDQEYLFYNDGCGAYGYSCSVRFDTIYSHRMFATCRFKRISEMPLNHRLYGAPRLLADEQVVAWEDVRSARVDNIHFDVFATSAAIFESMRRYLHRILHDNQLPTE